MGRSAPIRSMRAHPMGATYYTPLSDLGEEARSSAPRLGHRAVLLALCSVLLLLVLLLVRIRGGDFSLRRLLRLFAGWIRTPTRKKSYGHPRNPKRCALPCSPMAKVELGEVRR